MSGWSCLDQEGRAPSDRVAGQNNAKTMTRKSYTQTNWIIHSVLMILMIRKGELHLTESVCPRDFLGELEYWGLSALHLGYIKRYKIIFSKFKYLRLAPRHIHQLKIIITKFKYHRVRQLNFHRAMLRLHVAEGLLAPPHCWPWGRSRGRGDLFSSFLLVSFFFSSPNCSSWGQEGEFFLEFFGNRHSVSFKTPAHFGYFLLENKKAALGRYFVLSSPVP